MEKAQDPIHNLEIQDFQPKDHQLATLEEQAHEPAELRRAHPQAGILLMEGQEDWKQNILQME